MPHSTRALEGIRVLEIASAAGQYCGKMFAELGADVILIEPPGGAATRGRAPFVGGMEGGDNPVRSLSFTYFNTSKRSITLDLETDEGQSLFLELAACADVVIEGEKPGYLASLGCGFDALLSANPSLVLTSITAFGQTGPYCQYEAEDLIALATGGFLYLGGYPDSSPIGAYGNQAQAGGSMFGAVATMIALTHAETSGQGEHVDVSMQECMVLAMENAVQFYDLEGIVRKRTAGAQRFAGTGVYACRDGHVYMMAGGIGANRFWGRTLEWLAEEKVAGLERLQGEEWHQVPYLQSDEAKQIFMDVFGAWAMTKTKAYLYRAGQDRHVPAAAINTVADLVENEQLQARGYFVELDQPGWPHPVLMPGAPYQLEKTPWSLRSPAPLPGQHNAEVYASVKRAPAALAQLADRRVI
jgi:benzylsuccinate CoA-transferase BbsE subunit